MAVLTYDEYIGKKKKKGEVAPVQQNAGRVLSYEDYLKGLNQEKTLGTNSYFKTATGNIGQKVIGSGLDAFENFGAGVLGIGEKLLDFGLTVAPVIQNQQYYQNGGVYDLKGQKLQEQNFRAQQEGNAEIVKKDLYDEQKIAKNILQYSTLGRTAKQFGANSETNSVFGDKSDALIQSGGQLAATIGLDLATGGIGGNLLTGATAFGAQMESALKEGATVEEARMSASISAGAEILTEKLSGGIKFGGKTLDEKFITPLAEKISNDAVRTMAKFGMDVVGEGVEEVASELISNLGTSLYKEEDLTEILASEEALQGYLDSFIGGAVLGGVASGAKVVAGKNSGVDYTTGLTAEEKKVVDAVVKSRRAEQESSGKKMTNKERYALRDKVMQELERGYIGVEAIEEALGDKTNNGKSVQQLVEGSRLEESYREAGRRREAFSADLSKYPAKQQSAIQRAVESGILNNTNRSHDFVDFLAKVEAEKGISFDFTSSEKLKNTGFAIEGRDINGLVTDGRIILNANSSRALNSVAGHEITHVLEGTELYQGLQEAVFAYAKTKGEYDTRYTELQKLYTGADGKLIGKNTSIEAELTADLVGDYIFTDEDFVKNLSAEQPGIFEKILQEIKHLCKLATAGSREARQLEKAKHIFETVYKESIKISEDTRYSLYEFEDGRKFVEIDQEQNRFDGHDRAEYPSIAKAVINEKFTGKVIGQDHKMYVNGRGRDEYTHPRKPIKEDYVYEAKMRASSELDNLLDAGEILPSKSDGADGHIHENALEWEYYKTVFKVGENYFEGVINIEVTSRGKLFKDVTKIKDVTEDIMNSYGKNPKFQCLRTSSNDSIAQSQKNTTPNETFSLSRESRPSTGYQVKGEEVYRDEAKTGSEVKDTGNSQYVYDITLNEAGSLPDSRGSYDGSSPASMSIISHKKENATEKENFSLLGDGRTSTGYQVKGEDVIFRFAENVVQQPVLSFENSEIKQIAETIQQVGEAATRKEEAVRLRKAERKQMRDIDFKLRAYRRERAEMNNNLQASIDSKKAEYESLKRKDTKKAEVIFAQIESLKRRKASRDAEYGEEITKLEEAKDNVAKKAAARQRHSVHEKYREEMRNLMGDTSKWKDKKMGISYKLQTLQRNLRDTVKDSEGNADYKKADAIYDALQGRYNANEAKLNRESRELKQKFKAFNINKTEDVYIQMLGEYRYNPDTSLKGEDMTKFFEANKDKIDEQKVDRIIEMARETYDSLFERVNDVLRVQGMSEMGYRKGYFPHFTEEKQSPLAKLLNWRTQKDEIPTDIAGLTEMFTPDRTYQGFDKHRTGDSTDYSFMKGFDTYVHGALDWIYHIEDIQRRRAFENEIRYQHSPKYLQEEMTKILENDALDEEMQQAELDELYNKYSNPLGNFVQDIRRSTNMIAGKKASGDREMEANVGRRAYSVMTNVSNRVSANMVAGSISSALTNFIPITQSWGQVSPVSSLRALKDVIGNYAKDDGMIDKSDFMTNRLRTEESLYKNTWDKISDKLGWMMETVDGITTQVVWRSKYIENVEAGMSEAEAVRNADRFAENVMAGRSRGNMPTAFHEKNPVSKIFTQFQLEVANQYGYMFKDLPQEVGTEAKGKLVNGYAAMFIGAHVYNALYSSLVGRDAAFDPISIIGQLIRELFFEEEEEKTPATAFADFGLNVAQELPFIGGLLGGGRIPISTAFPYDGDFTELITKTAGNLEQVVNGLGDLVFKQEEFSDKEMKALKELTQEWLNPVIYLVSPIAGGQAKKTVEGSMMFLGKDVTGSYTNDGKLRFAVENIPEKIGQALLFGQYASSEAREYFDRGETPLSTKQMEEFKELDVSISEYWDIKQGLKGKDLSEKADFINGLDIPVEKKNILINNATDRKEKIDMSDYGLYLDFDEFNFAQQNPSKYKLARAMGGYETYKSHVGAISSIKADTDSNGKSITGSRKEKVLWYINNANVSYSTKLLLYKNTYPADDTYNREIVSFIREQDISHGDKKAILTELGFTVDEDGTVRW